MIVIVDELYSRLVYDGRSFAHLIGEEGMRERCITLLGPSKTESMSGYRVGAAVARAPASNAGVRNSQRWVRRKAAAPAGFC